MPDASHAPSSSRELDVAIVGGGLGGLYAIHRLRGMGLKVRAYEAGSGVGGIGCTPSIVVLSLVSHRPG